MEQKDKLHLMMKKTKKELSKELLSMYDKYEERSLEKRKLIQERDIIRIDRDAHANHSVVLKSKITQAKQTLLTVANTHFPDSDISFCCNDNTEQNKPPKTEVNFLRYLFSILNSI